MSLPGFVTTHFTMLLWHQTITAGAPRPSRKLPLVSHGDAHYPAHPIEYGTFNGYCISPLAGRRRPSDGERHGRACGTSTNRPRRASAASRAARSRPKSLTVDMHAHVAIPQAAELVKGHLDPSTVPLDHFSTPETKALMAKQAADIGPGIRPTDVRFKTMDDMGVDMQLICPGPPQLYYTVPVEIRGAGDARPQRRHRRIRRQAHRPAGGARRRAAAGRQRGGQGA